MSAPKARASWPSIKNGIDKFWVPQANGRKIYLTEVRCSLYHVLGETLTLIERARRTDGRPR